MGFPRREYWSGLPFPSLGVLPDPGIKPGSPALAGEFFTTEPPWKPCDESHGPPNVGGKPQPRLSTLTEGAASGLCRQSQALLRLLGGPHLSLCTCLFIVTDQAVATDLSLVLHPTQVYYYKEQEHGNVFLRFPVVPKYLYLQGVFTLISELPREHSARNLVEVAICTCGSRGQKIKQAIQQQQQKPLKVL